MTSLVVREFRDDLARLQRKHRGQRELDWRALHLLALEREQLVTVQYADEKLHARIDALDAPDDVRALVHHALRWASRDEESHAVSARGVLFRRGERVLALRALLQQLGGLVAGWASAVTQHVTFARAPFARALSTLVGYAGLVAGKVPASARTSLKYRSFTEFAGFNVEAEETAALCWERIAELDQQDRELHRRVASDERKHAEVFRALSESFDANDALRPGITAESLGRRLHDVDPVFVPRSLRSGDNPLGTGADVVVREDRAASPASLLREAVVDSGLIERVLRGRGSCKVAIKTQFMMSYDRRDRSTTVDADLGAELCELFHQRGAADIAVLESRNLFDRYYAARSVDNVARYMGLRFPHARLVDASGDQVPHRFARGLGQNSVSRTWRDADVRVSLGKMRTNPSFLVHLTLANLETLGQRIEELLFADRLADTGTGLMMTLDEFPCHLAVLDASHDVADGLTGILGTAEPRHPGRVYASEDAVALDWVAVRHMGLSALPRGASCHAALDWFGDVRALTRVVGVDERIVPFTNPHQDDARIFLSALAYPVYAYLSDGGSLWMPKMDPAEFPLSADEGLVTFIARRLLRQLFRFGSPVGEWE
ncbi:MAG TPA: DUF362 domain-containing protein [Minicystis sp.]|nr:DUF362 domain-containing protein [Minicystis sp.]